MKKIFHSGLAAIGVVSLAAVLAACGPAGGRPGIPGTGGQPAARLFGSGTTPYSAGG